MDTGYYISKKDYDKIISYATAAYESMKAEIGGMSICYQDEDGDWIVTDPVILKQKVTGSTCDLDQEALADYYCKAAKKHGKKNFRFCWWHSHHTMGVFWSATDIKGINEYSDGDLSFALVVNLKRENKFRASMWQPVVMHEDTTLEILENKGSSVPKKILTEVEELCEKPAYNYTSWKDRKKDDKMDQVDMWDQAGYNYSYGAYAENRINHGTEPSDALRSGQFFNYCYNQIADWIDEMAQGTLMYSTYVKEVEKANKELEKMRSGYSFVVIGQNELSEELEWQDPAMWIRIDNQSVVDLTRENNNGVGIKQ